MPAFLKESHAFKSDLTGDTHVEIKYTRYIDGEGYQNFADCFTTKPVGGWTDLKSQTESMRYEDFLDTMVEKTVVVRRVMALIQLDNCLCENNNIYSLIRIMNAVKIIDPTYEPSFINITCGWQKRFIKDFCTRTLPTVVETCNNEMRLEKLFNVLKSIEQE